MTGRLHSLQLRLHALGILVFLFLLGSAIAFALILRHSEAETLAQTSRHLDAVATALAREYSAQVRGSRNQLLLEGARSATSDQSLAEMTSTVLDKEIGIEGGFYSRSGDVLLGYAFPTHEGPGVKKDLPGKELPTILNLARKAAATGKAQSLVFQGYQDDVAFHAGPVVRDGQVPGSVWLMKRLPGLRTEQNLKTYAGLAILGLAAAFCVLLAFLIARNLRSGIAVVEERLRQLETDLAALPRHNAELAEVERILGGVNRLAGALREKIAVEHNLEEKLRHSERLAALGRVAAGVAHELRNPLATIRLRTQLSVRNAQPESVERNGAVVLEEIARLDHMVERLLFFSRPLRISLQRVDIRPILEESLRAHSQTLSNHLIHVGLEKSERPLVASVDPSAFRQLMDNLIKNAIDAIGNSEGEVLVSAEESPGGVSRIEVRDSGPGISQDDLARIFDPFFTTKPSGTGLGLSICYEIVKAHGGEIQVQSAPRQGTRIIVALPGHGDRLSQSQANIKVKQP